MTPIYTRQAYNIVIWQEGLLIDFLQKLSLNRFLTRIVNTSFTIVNEKFFFEPLTRVFLDNLIWSLSTFNPHTNTSMRFSLYIVFLLIAILTTAVVLVLSFQVAI